jgi:phage baseplate assembly protein W
LEGIFPYTATLTHTYQADGFYLVQLNVANRLAPVPDTAKVIISVEISTGVYHSAEANLPGFIFGPILPRDRGFPTRGQWCFHLGKDVQVLESNLRLIILTSFGERLYDSAFGTNVRRVIFENDQRLVETVLREEISMAVARYEPRVNIDSISVFRDGSAITLNASFVPKDKANDRIELSVNLT